jgi:tryptophan synthase alpha chain
LNPIDALFGRLRPQGRKAFIPFLTAGDPDTACTVRLARAVAAAGADLLEIGFPYSDPIADGPVIQASYTRALDRGVRLDDVFDCARQIAAAPEFAGGRVPLVGMVSYSIVHRRGAEAFLDRALASGFSGAIVPDLPADESEALARLAAARDLKLVQLVTPTTPRPRTLEIARRSTGFLYCVSVTGITGVRDALPADLSEQLAWLRRQTDLPLCVGFGISRPEQVQSLREVADGVIVGSALVRHVEQAAPLEKIAAALADLVRSLSTALNPDAAARPG